MRDIGYKYIDNNIDAHNLFKEKILQLRHNVDIDNIEVTKELIVYLGKWLLNHVIAEDKKYSI
jgi:hemerythrin